MRYFLLMLFAACGWSAVEPLGAGPALGAGPVPVTSAAPSGAAGGGLGGTYPNPTVTLTAGQVGYGSASNTLTSDSAFTRGTLTFGVDPNTDNTLTSGYAKIGSAPSGVSTAIYLAQASCYTTTDFALFQNASGSTVINAKTGQSVFLKINSTTKATLTSASLTLASGVPLTLSDTTDSTSATTGAGIVSGGLGVAKTMFTGAAVGGHARSVVSAAGTTVLDGTDHLVVVTGSTTQTITLPAASLGHMLWLKNRSSGTVTVNRAGSDTIDGATSITLTGAANQGYILAPVGTDYLIYARAN